jgi:exopolyphosphatase/guanosine-5'-triphosphate,3'-diphosphate pyrophosphatase
MEIRAMAERVAAIDCGTNSTRLLIADADQTVERHMKITRLGQDVDRTGRLDPAAIERTASVLGDYRVLLDRHSVKRVRITATSAARDAQNSDEFFDAAESIIGSRPELLSGPEEAALSFAGATRELDPADGPFMVVDIGGGSTEFAVGSEVMEGSLSTNMGCVRMTEKYIASDPPQASELSSCLSEIELHIDDVMREVPDIGAARQFVGLAGTVSAAAAIELGLEQYDRDRTHHFRLTKAAAEDVFRTLVMESLADRIHNPGLEEQRAEVIVGGMCILVAIMRRFDCDDCLVSEADILDGLVGSMLW